MPTNEALDHIVVKAKRFSCHRCQRLFGRLEHLQRHERTHTQERPFACIQCESRFTRRDLLIRHERLSHQKRKGATQQTATNESHYDPEPEIGNRGAKRQETTSNQKGGLDASSTPHQAGSNFDEAANFAVGGADDQSLYSNLENVVDGNGEEMVRSYDALASGLVGRLRNVSAQARDISPGLLEEEGAGRLSIPLGSPDPIALALPVLTESPPSVTSTNSNSYLPNTDLIFPFIDRDPTPAFSPSLNQANTSLYLTDFTALLETASDSADGAFYCHFEPLISVDIAQPPVRVLQLEAFASSDQPSDNDALNTILAQQQHDNRHTPAPIDSQSESGLSSAHHEEHQNTGAATRHQQLSLPPANGWLSHLSPSDRAEMQTKMADFNGYTPGFRLPTQLSLARYLRRYVEGFHCHLPFLHIPTLTVQSSPIELLLAMAAVGAQYCFEADKGVDLFSAAKAIAFERIRRRGTGTESSMNLIPTVQALLILMAMGTWSNHSTILYEDSAIQSTLGRLVREDGLAVDSRISDAPETWQSWSRAESTLRTKLIAFCFFNLHSIIYNISPLILTADVSMRLPCNAAEFQATTEAEWREARAANPLPATHFQAAFDTLFSPPRPRDSGSPTHSSLGNYVLIHAIIQQIFLMRASKLNAKQSSLAMPAEDIALIKRALSKWRLDWERSPESSLDPIDHKNPLSFNSTALLRLAYIRLNMNPGSGGLALEKRDPELVAQAMRSLSEPLQRSPALTEALQHAAEGFSVPVRIGINLVAKTQTFTWSIQHSLCSLECALLLSKWLEAVASVSEADDSMSPTDEEYSMLKVLETMLGETKFAVPEGPKSVQELAAHLNIGVLRVWASIFRGSQTWAVVDIIGTALGLYADMLDTSDAESID